MRVTVVSGVQAWLVEGQDDHGGGGEGSDDEPVAAAYPEVGDGTPEEVDGLGECEKKDDLALALGVYAMLAEEVRESSGDYAVGKNG